MMIRRAGAPIPIGRYQYTAGFTLVELLVAIAIVSVLMVLLLGALRFGRDATVSTARKSDRSFEISAAYRFLREALGNAQPLSDEVPGAEPPLLFDGERDHLDFVTLVPAYLAPAGFHLLRLGLEADARTNRLVLRWRGSPRGPTATGTGAIAPSVLLDRIVRVEFAYFGPISDGAPATWHPRWRAATRLPDLVRLRIALADGGAVPDLVVALRVADDVIDGR